MKLGEDNVLTLFNNNMALMTCLAFVGVSVPGASVASLTTAGEIPLREVGRADTKLGLSPHDAHYLRSSAVVVHPKGAF